MWHIWDSFSKAGVAKGLQNEDMRQYRGRTAVYPELYHSGWAVNSWELQWRALEGNGCIYSPWRLERWQIVWCWAGARTGWKSKPLEKGNATLASNTVFLSGRQTCDTRVQTNVNGDEDAHQSGVRMSFSLCFSCFQISPCGFAGHPGEMWCLLWRSWATYRVKAWSLPAMFSVVC